MANIRSFAVVDTAIVAAVITVGGTATIAMMGAVVMAISRFSRLSAKLDMLRKEQRDRYDAFRNQFKDSQTQLANRLDKIESRLFQHATGPGSIGGDRDN